MITVSGLDNFPWPKPRACDELPLWRGDGFLVGGEIRRILEFGAADSHWSSELAEFVEEEGGSNHPMDRASRRLAADSLKRFLATDTPILLDIGCSAGYFLEEIRRILPKAALIGSDYLIPPLAKLAERMPGLPILQFDLRCCPLADECVDAVTALHVLEHIDKDEEALAHIYRILRPGGIAHIEVPAGPHLFDVYDEYVMHHRRYRLAELKMMAHRLGFKILKSTYFGCLLYPAFWLVKKRNRCFSNRHKRDPAAQVRAQIRDTVSSKLIEGLMRIELRLLRAMSFPFGIRCVLIMRKAIGIGEN